MGRLSRLGFANASSALDAWLNLCRAFPALDESLLGVVSEAPDPDAALAGLSRVLDSASDAPGLVAALASDTDFAQRVLAVLGASSALTDHLVRRPGNTELLADPLLTRVRPTAQSLRDELLAAVGADAAAAAPRASVGGATAYDALRVAYRRALLKVAARDLTAAPDVMDIAAELADLASGALEAALAIARTEIGDDADTVKFSVIGMGKCGGHELNYISDVDVIYVVEPSRRY